jgi:Mn-dependent DtxR family transcriptional regulator
MDDLITTERVGIVTRRLALGERGTTAEIAEWVGISRQSAWEMLTKLSRVNPLTIVDGKWCDCQVQPDASLLQFDA